MASPIHYSWKPDDDGQTYKRLAHGIEASNAFNSKYDRLWSMYTSLTICSQGSHEDFLSDIKNAWIQLRHEAPIIATKVEPAPSLGDQYNQFVYEMQTASEIQDWAKETIHVLEPMAKEEVHTSVMEDRSRLAYNRSTGNLYISPDSVDAATYRIVFASPHATTDVRGSITVLHRLLELASDGSRSSLDSLKWGDEVKRLYPPVVYAAGLRHDDDRPPQDVDQVMADLATSQAPFTPSAVLRHNHDAKPYATTALPIMSALTLEKDTHGRIIEAGRNNGTSITGVVAGILAILSLKYNEEPSAKSVSIWGVATDRRARLPDHFKPFYSQAIWSKSILLNNMQAIRTATCAIFEQGVIGSDYWSICRDFKEDLDAFAKDDSSLAISNELVMAGLTAKGGIFEHLPPAHIFYSSYGQYDKILQHSYGEGRNQLQVDDPHCMALCHNLPVVALSSSSWKGRLTIFSQHSRSYYEEEDVKAFYADMQTCFDAIAASSR